MKRQLEPSTARTEQADPNPHLAGQPVYLLTAEAADLLRFNTPHLFHKWALRNRVPVLRRGRTLLYERRVLEALLRQKRHGARTVTAQPSRLTGDPCSR